MRKTLMLGALALLAAPEPADACGGCFHGEPAQMGAPDPQVVTGHRMVLSTSSQQTTLWDQIRYTGSPDQFIWVLPIADATTVTLGLASPAFIDALDTLSTPSIQSPTVTCNANGTSTVSRGYGGGCGGSTFSYADDSGSDQSTTLHGHDDSMMTGVTGAVVGLYAAEVIGARMGTAPLDEWLTQKHFVIPSDVRPAIQFYVDHHFDFLVLHLRPGVGVQQMQPVRVSVPGYSPTLPLRMIAAGTSDSVGLTLMVIAGTSMRVENFDNVVIPDTSLVYDLSAQRSNYRELFDAAVRTGGRPAWVTESVQSLLEGMIAPEDAGAPTDAGLQVPDAFDPMPPMGDMDAAMDLDALAPASDAMLGMTGTADGSTMPRRADPLVDRGVAFAGFGGYARLTRLRTVLNKVDLGADLVLSGDVIQVLGPQRAATRAINANCPVLRPTPSAYDAGTTSSTPSHCAVRSTNTGRRAPPLRWLVGTALIGLALHRRTRRRSRRNKKPD